MIPQLGKSSYAIAMSIMTTEDDETGLIGVEERNAIRTTWNKAKKDGDVAPKLLFKYV